MVASGQLSANAADMLIEINHCIGKGILKVDTNHKVKTTPTTLELFSKKTFAPAFQQASSASISEKMQGFFLKGFLKVAGNQLLKKEDYK